MRISGKIKLLIPLFVLVFMVSALCTPFSADEQEQSGKITVLYELENIPFSLYKVGEITESGVVLSGDFAHYKVNLHSDHAAYTLSSYATRDALTPLKISATGENGAVLFSELEKGVYLVCGESTYLNGEHYTVNPSLISVPYVTDGKEEWNITAQAKFEKNVEEDFVDISVVKVWEAFPGEFSYPDVEIQLLNDSGIFDTVTLNSENNWNYTWKKLDNHTDWSITEIIPEDAEYTVDIIREGYIFTVTNIVDHEESTEPTSPTTPTLPTSPTSSTAPTVPTTVPVTTPDTPLIPQTGQLNWPIPVFSTAGVLFIAFGVLIGRKNNE